MDKIGLVTITYNSADVLQPFLDCVWRQTHDNLMLYVIDNASQDATCSILEKENDSRLKIINNSTNFGVAKANNQGIESAITDGCDQILIVNNDVEFETTLIEKLLQGQAEKSCSLVTPKMMYFDNPNHIWYAGSWFIKKKGYSPLHRGMKQLDEGQYDEIVEVEYAPTCCLLAKKEVFQDIGLMDEKYFVYFDDTDFSYRVWKDRRHKMFYYPDVKFYHKVGSLTNSFNKKGDKIFRGDFFIQQNIKNHIYFLKKIGGFFAYAFIVWLFFKNNTRFIVNPQIRKNFKTWLLINKSYFEGVRM
ncbi:MAG TPA: glycosyltransferase family 2 protein [Flavobacteriales bacterium]|nr:glycosyltransferase family 2 protein [Flavobacteriales bacterium]HIK63067.1 glycosyltransferase family 2 protein [Flavobacteriales bacterium]